MRLSLPAIAFVLFGGFHGPAQVPSGAAASSPSIVFEGTWTRTVLDPKRPVVRPGDTVSGNGVTTKYVSVSPTLSLEGIEKPVAYSRTTTTIRYFDDDSVTATVRTDASPKAIPMRADGSLDPAHYEWKPDTEAEMPIYEYRYETDGSWSKKVLHPPKLQSPKEKIPIERLRDAHSPVDFLRRRCDNLKKSGKDAELIKRDDAGNPVSITIEDTKGRIRAEIVAEGWQSGPVPFPTKVTERKIDKASGALLEQTIYELVKEPVRVPPPRY